MAKIEEIKAAVPDIRINVMTGIVFLLFFIPGVILAAAWKNPVIMVAFLLVALIAAMAPRIAKQWEKAIVLRLGKFIGLRGPGLFWVVPLIDTVSLYIDQRVITTSFAAEQTLTSDTVPVNVDAVLFWMVYDAEKAALEVQQYQDAQKAKGERRKAKGKSKSEVPRHKRSTFAFRLCGAGRDVARGAGRA